MTAAPDQTAAHAVRPAPSAHLRASATLGGLLAVGLAQMAFQDRDASSFGLIYWATAKFFGKAFQDNTQDIDARARDRLPVINTALRAANGPFILLAGDSHAALAAGSPLCGHPTVNGGAGGAGTRVYRNLSRELNPRMRPVAVIITIGINDMLVRTKPSAPAAMVQLTRDAGAIISDLASITDRLVVTAVPPVSARVAGKFDAKAIVSFSGELRRLCADTPNCTFADPFASIRSDIGFHTARPGTLSDDLHLADYPAAYRALKPLICPVSETPLAEGG